MKKGIHPDYRPVVFQDAAANFAFLTRSSIETDETIQWTDGKEYPLYKLEISSASHPFFTGKMKLLDTTGRVQKFQDRYKNTKYAAKSEAEVAAAAEKKAAAPAAAKPAEKPAAKPAEKPADKPADKKKK